MALSTVFLGVGMLAGCGGSGNDPNAEPEAIGGPPVMRLLTEAQYRATVADIFGPDVPVVARFERALRSEGLIALGTSESGISPFSVEQYDAAALAIAAAVVSEEKRGEALSCAPASETDFDEACAITVVEDYGPRLYRRPLTQEDTDRFVEAALAGYERLGNFYGALELALAGMLVSPEFLLRIERVEPDPADKDALRLDAYSKATRLSYFLTNSAPDEELLRAAGAGELDTEEGVAGQVDRLIASPHFERAVRAFFEDMLEFDMFDDLAKDPVIYPTFNSTVAEEAQEQTLRTVVEHVIEQDGDYRDLFTTRSAHLTRSLGTIYRLPVSVRNGWQTGEFPEGSGRAGIHTNIAFLAQHSHPGRSSATLRGVAIREVFLCQEVPDPPPDVDFSVVQDPSNTAMPTARDRLMAHQTQPACSGCHAIMDPLGLTLENFDGVGAFRTKENDAPIDTSGSLDGLEFIAANGLGEALRDHPETPRCLVNKMYRSAVGRDTTMGEIPYIEYLNRIFAEGGFRVPDLMRAIALSDSFFAISEADEGDHNAEHAGLGADKGDRS